MKPLEPFSIDQMQTICDGIAAKTSEPAQIIGTKGDWTPRGDAVMTVVVELATWVGPWRGSTSFSGKQWQRDPASVVQRVIDDIVQMRQSVAST